ncbi:MAG: ATP-binding protein [Candidatus Kapabacteria bacterium]|nr:ATP-binding protein [Candidatus Kapabacteria bacterium]MDW8012266.1 ATP-binding protein [Bacteroidota bacterium]
MQRLQHWLLPIGLPLVALLAAGELGILFYKRNLEAELRRNGDDIIAIAAYRDSVQLQPGRAFFHQHALRERLSSDRSSPYRGISSFMDSLGLWDTPTFLHRCRTELAILGAHQSRLVDSINRADTLQFLLLGVIFIVTLSLFPLLAAYRSNLQRHAQLLTKLQESEARYRDLVEHVPDLIQSVAADGRFVYVNRYWRQVMGYGEEEIRQLRIWDILRPDQIPKCQDLFRRVFQDRVLFNVETVFVTKQGEPLYVSGNVTVLPDPVTGELVTRALFRDITEQCRQVEQLQRQEAIANTVSRIAQQLLATLHPEAIAPTVLAQLGDVLNVDTIYMVALPEGTPHVVAVWSREKELEQTIRATFSPPCWENCQPLRDRLSAIAVVEATAEELSSAPAFQQCHRPVQSLLWVPITRQGHLWGLIGTEDWRTVRSWLPTERTALESTAASLLSAFDRASAYQQLQRFAEDLLEARNALEVYAQELRQANEELQERNAEKDRIMSIISHDLRSPLGGIRGLAELLQGEDAENPRVVREFAQLIGDTVNHLLSLVNDLLEVARIESGRLRLSASATDLRELVHSAVRVLDGLARSKEIALYVECPESPVIATVDAPKIAQVINNLLSNAIKFTPRGGRVILTLHQQAQGVKLVVEDTGIGIPPEHMPHLFEKLGPHQRPGTDGEKGTGLGMPIIKHLVELHGGSITVESTVGVGTRITVYLPSCPPVVAEEAPFSHHCSDLPSVNDSLLSKQSSRRGSCMDMFRL